MCSHMLLLVSNSVFFFSHQQDGVEDIVVEGRLIDTPVSADALTSAVHHVGNGEFGYGHSRWLSQFGQRMADICIL